MTRPCFGIWCKMSARQVPTARMRPAAAPATGGAAPFRVTTGQAPASAAASTSPQQSTTTAPSHGRPNIPPPQTSPQPGRPKPRILLPIQRQHLLADPLSFVRIVKTHLVDASLLTLPRESGLCPPPMASPSKNVRDDITRNQDISNKLLL